MNQTKTNVVNRLYDHCIITSFQLTADSVTPDVAASLFRFIITDDIKMLLNQELATNTRSK